MHIFVLHVIIIVEVVNMTNNTQFKTLLNTWLNQKKPMITPSTHASFTLIAENHLIPHFGKRKIGSITSRTFRATYRIFTSPGGWISPAVSL